MRRCPLWVYLTLLDAPAIASDPGVPASIWPTAEQTVSCNTGTAPPVGEPVSYESLALLCLMSGLVLLIAEFFLPTGGIIGILSLVSMAVSVWAAWEAWHLSRPALWYTYLLTLVVVIPGAIYGLVRVLRETRYGEHIFLPGPPSDELTPYEDEARHLEELLGETGTARTNLLPSGVCRINGERLDCVSEGPIIEAGVRVTVVGHRNGTPIVRPSTAEEMQPRRPPQTQQTVDTTVEPAAEPPPRPKTDDAIVDPFADE